MKGTINFSHTVDRKSECQPILEFSGKSSVIEIDPTVKSRIKFYNSINAYDKLFDVLRQAFESTVVENELDKLLDGYDAYRKGGELIVKCTCKHPTTCLGRVLHDMLIKHEIINLQWYK
ncbi:hypothetical protein SP15_144 [Bacillus phage SP-15]|uniref:Uncharacterized protein n=1 Tax=Bacillus phage SP-15 TaxID=1792032 RepID=A0A127AWI0_9CAUD|nr:hypothetical protein SP15_144 [Bacillus phage SP-15]AMM44942.1 hypothetical protein SP15_144 [Bacillus phage SP-15]